MEACLSRLRRDGCMIARPFSEMSENVDAFGSMLRSPFGPRRLEFDWPMSRSFEKCGSLRIGSIFALIKMRRILSSISRMHQRRFYSHHVK